MGQKFDFTDGTKGYFPVGINFDEQDLLDRGVAIEYLDTSSVKIADGVTVYGSFDKDPSFPAGSQHAGGRGGRHLRGGRF